jgi:hypothetical protein
MSNELNATITADGVDIARNSVMSLQTISMLLAKLTGSSTRADDVGDVVVGRIGWGSRRVSSRSSRPSRCCASQTRIATPS